MNTLETTETNRLNGAGHEPDRFSELDELLLGNHASFPMTNFGKIKWSTMAEHYPAIMQAAKQVWANAKANNISVYLNQRLRRLLGKKDTKGKRTSKREKGVFTNPKFTPLDDFMRQHGHDLPKYGKRIDWHAIRDQHPDIWQIAEGIWGTDFTHTRSQWSRRCRAMGLIETKSKTAKRKKKEEVQLPVAKRQTVLEVPPSLATPRFSFDICPNADCHAPLGIMEKMLGMSLKVCPKCEFPVAAAAEGVTARLSMPDLNQAQHEKR
jgi:hypothetical protein